MTEQASDKRGPEPMNPGSSDVSVKTKAALIDPRSLSVWWMNETAEQDLADDVGGFVPGMALEVAVPMATLLGVADALKDLSGGGARHLSTSLVSTSKGGLQVVASLYPLPDGQVLLLIENVWQPKQAASQSTGARRPTRRSR